MLNLITINVCVYIYKCIKIVNINTETNNHTCIILTNQAYTIYRYCLHTVRHIVYELRRIPTSCLYSSDELSPRRSVPTMKRQATKSHRNKTAGDEVYP